MTQTSLCTQVNVKWLQLKKQFYEVIVKDKLVIQHTKGVCLMPNLQKCAMKKQNKTMGIPSPCLLGAFS